MLKRGLLHGAWRVCRGARNVRKHCNYISSCNFPPRAPHPCSYYQSKTSGAPRHDQSKENTLQGFDPEGGPRESKSNDRCERRLLYVCVCGFVHACM